ncbi:hypothetical protein P5609_001365 [Bacillus licheniformis]|uniref:hypothetical protein n=1 Tax=Bacillus licheniformis TaxID=1402 RepID=UPI00018C8053|nr:hypothetical protein [Bacillus licheniformis]MDH3162338.1 hypothetical protein [Bacillus licheniformis]MED4409024.1 hypothetical protein [Bacillus licheniformis]QDL76921.1 hypothetical protein D9Y32_05340 [Bacillus licheniformis]
MKLIDILTKNVKNAESTEKVVQKAQNEMNAIQAEISEKNKQKQQLQQAMNVIFASLVIDPDDKNALTQKKKADNKISELDKELEKLTEKAKKAQEALTQAQKDNNTSKGEVFKQEYIQGVTLGSFKLKLEHLPERMNRKFPSYSYKNWVDWSKAYGLPVQSVVTPAGVRLEERRENVPFLKEQQREAEAIGIRKAEELIAKVEKAIEEILAEEGIELNK